MHNMLSFEFYRDIYLGSLIPEASFGELAGRAGEYLEKFKRVFRVEGGEQAQAMALCAMAETLFRYRDRDGLRSATVGGVSVSYREGRGGDLTRQLYLAAQVYLDIYRGCQDA